MQGTKNLTEGVISRQLFNLAMPIMGTSFIQMAYSITDMAWVGRLGSEAVAAIGAVGILTWMTNSISYLNKVGSEVSVGQSIGAQNVENGSCGVLSFGLKGGREVAIKFMDSLKLAAIVTHVADARTCVLHPASHTHRQLSDEQLIEAGVAPDLIRFSVGIESADDIIADIEQALNK